MSGTRRSAPLRLQSGGLDAARLALAPAPQPRVRSRWVLLCAGLMTASALALCAVVVLGGWSPQAVGLHATEVRGPLRR